MNGKARFAVLLVALPSLVWTGAAAAHDPDYTAELDRSRCTFTTVGSNPYFPLWPGLSVLLEGIEEDDEGELVEIASLNSILADTELVDGVLTRVYEERESEDEELTEISRNFVAMCRETGDIWYFGEDVDIYEDGEVVSHDGAWRAGVDGAEPGILVPGSPLVGARHFQEIAPDVALDRSEVLSLGGSVTVPLGTFTNVLEVADSSALDPEGGEDIKVYARWVGNVLDEVLEAVEMTAPPCQPDTNTHCLNDGRFRVEVEWKDFSANEGLGSAILPSDDSGEFWFFSPNNTELLVKVLDACDNPSFGTFWVFAGGLTDVEVELTVTDTTSGEQRVYENPLGTPFQPVLDTGAFATCP